MSNNTFLEILNRQTTEIISLKWNAKQLKRVELLKTICNDSTFKGISWNGIKWSKVELKKWNLVKFC